MRLASSMNESQAKLSEAWMAALQTQIRTSCTACTCLSSSFVMCVRLFLETYLSSISGRLSLRSVVVQRLLKFLSHFKCLIGGAPSMLWIASWTEIRFSQIRFSLGDSKLNRITFHWNPGRGTPKTCQESNPQKLTDDGSVVFCCPFKPNHLDTWCWGKVLLQPRPIIICNYMA